MPFISENSQAQWSHQSTFKSPDGNALVNKFTQLITLSQVELEQRSHALDHQNSKS